MTKLRLGGTLRVAAIGGSITTGYAARPPSEAGWAAGVEKWLREKAREAGGAVVFRNAGVSGTDSAFAALRVRDHVIDFGADLVIVEFAINDQWLDKSVRGRSYEGLARRLLADSDRAVICLYLNERGGPARGMQSEQAKIAAHYGLPSVSWGDSLGPLVSAGKTSWDVMFDGAETIHPNDAGHASIARFVTAFLEEAWEGGGTAADAPSLTLPAPLFDDDFQYARLSGSPDLDPIENSGWTKGSELHGEWRNLGGAKEGWTSREDDARISFRLRGESVGLTCAESDQYRDAEAWVELPDGTASRKVALNCFVPYRNGYLGWAYREIARFPEPRDFILRVRVKKSGATDKGKSANFTGVALTGKAE